MNKLSDSFKKKLLFNLIILIVVIPCIFVINFYGKNIEVETVTYLNDNNKVVMPIKEEDKEDAQKKVQSVENSSIKLEDKGHSLYEGEVKKDMYVSPFFKREGDYNFLFKYNKTDIALKIDLYEDNIKKLTASFSGKALEFTSKNILQLFLRHTFLTLFVVTRTLLQSIRLYLKGIKFNKVQEIDTKRRY